MNKSRKPGRYALDSLPPLTDAQRADLARLAEKPDSAIDTEDLPELSSATWAGATRGQFYKPTKTPITTRIDSDVLAWLKTDGGAYQSRMNAILRHVMLHPRIVAEHKVFQVQKEVDDASMWAICSLLFDAGSTRKNRVLSIQTSDDQKAKLISHGLDKMKQEFQSASFH